MRSCKTERSAREGERAAEKREDAFPDKTKREKTNGQILSRADTARVERHLRDLAHRVAPNYPRTVAAETDTRARSDVVQGRRGWRTPRRGHLFGTNVVFVVVVIGSGIDFSDDAVAAVAADDIETTPAAPATISRKKSPCSLVHGFSSLLSSALRYLREKEREEERRPGKGGENKNGKL